MHRHIDEFQNKVRNYFNEMLSGVAFTSLGKAANPSSDATISVIVSKGITTEPIPLSHLVKYTGQVTNGLTELFEVRVIAAWSDLLTNIFTECVKAQLNETATFPELSAQRGSIDFSSSDSIKDQLCRSISRDFSFSPYKERISTINKVCKHISPIDTHLQTIRKHVEIRNCFQHHGGLVTKDLLKVLGSNKLTLLDPLGEEFKLEINERIELCITELDLLKRSLFLVTTQWRNSNADIPA